VRSRRISSGGTNDRDSNTSQAPIRSGPETFTPTRRPKGTGDLFVIDDRSGPGTRLKT